LAQITPTGTAGRITHADLEQHTISYQNNSCSRTSDKRYEAKTAIEIVPVIGLRRKIAQKMQEAKRHIPHFTYVEEVDVTELEALRAQLNAQHGQTRGKLTLLPFLIRALVLAVREHPEVNARFDDDANQLSRYAGVHLGLATQTAGGLMVPVIRHAETLDLWACATEITRLAEAARSGKATREELTGSTLTLTSLGALGGIVSTPVINHPEVAIVGTNRIVERPMIRGGTVIARKMMNLSSSFDHRVVDGMNAAQFIQQIRGYLECPGTLLVE
jgi:2-oxoisovalerate dehydrogenase E2 component (dihydrolipoyl transacylase)